MPRSVLDPNARLGTGFATKEMGAEVRLGVTDSACKLAEPYTARIRTVPAPFSSCLFVFSAFLYGSGC